MIAQCAALAGAEDKLQQPPAVENEALNGKGRGVSKMEDLAPFNVEVFDEAKCFQNLLLQYESKHGTQALEFLQRDLSLSSQELKSKIVSAVRTDFDALARAPLEMLRLDDCVQIIEDKAHELQEYSVSSLAHINSVKSDIDCALENFQKCQLQRSVADAELQRVLWLHDLGDAVSRHDVALLVHPEMDEEGKDDLVAGSCLHLCVLAHAVDGFGSNCSRRASEISEVDAAAAAAVLAVQDLVLPLVKDAFHRLLRVPCYIRCLCLIARKDLVISTIADVITHPIISRVFSSAASRGSAAALLQLFTDVAKELCQLLQLFQRPKLLLSNNEEIDVCADLLLVPFFARLLKSEYCADFVQVDTVTDRYFAYMSGLQLLAASSACSASDDTRAFLQQQHEASSAVWALSLRALSQSRLSRIQSVVTPRLSGQGSITESAAVTADIDEAAAACGARTPAGAAVAWAITVALPSLQQPPPSLPRAMQLLCIVLANFSSWLKALADAASSSPQDTTAHASTPPSLTLLLRSSSDSSCVANSALASVKFHCSHLADGTAESALAHSLSLLTASGRKLYSAAVKIASAQLSELMVSVRSIAISFRQSSRPFPVSASAYVELQQQLLQRLADDVKTSGLTLNQQMEWLREVCDSAAGEWAACVDDILTTARRQDAFARKSRERAGSDAVGTGSSDALPKMEQQVRLDVEEVCRGWATLGLVTNDLAGIIKLRACVPIDSL